MSKRNDIRHCYLVMWPVSAFDSASISKFRVNRTMWR